MNDLCYIILFPVHYEFVLKIWGDLLTDLAVPYPYNYDITMINVDIVFRMEYNFITLKWAKDLSSFYAMASLNHGIHGGIR